MKTKKHDTRWMVSVALMAAIVIVLANTPLGMIQLPVIKATTCTHSGDHRRDSAGTVCRSNPGRGIWDLFADQQHNGPYIIILCVFAVYEYNGIPGALKAIWISVGCRILIGLISGWLWMLLMKLKMSQLIALPVVGFVGSMVNTVTVMGSIYLMFAREYAQAREVGVSAVWGLIMGTITASGIPEAIAAAVLVLALGKVLVGVFRKMNIHSAGSPMSVL